MIRRYQKAGKQIGPEVINVCDVNRYKEIYNDVKKLTKEDTTQLILEAKTEEEKNFYAMVGDFFLQRKQDECIARNVF